MSSPPVAPSSTAKPDKVPTTLPLAIFAYIMLLQLALTPLLFALYGDANAPFAHLDAAAVFPWSLNDPSALACYAIGIAAFVLAFQLPGFVLRRASAQKTATSRSGGASAPPAPSQAFGPYIIRLCLLETCTIAGFVLSFRAHAPFPILPFAALGIVGTALSYPSPEFFARFARISG